MQHQCRTHGLITSFNTTRQICITTAWFALRSGLTFCLPLPAVFSACLVAVLLADLGEKAGQYSSDVAVLGLVVGVLLGGGYILTQRTQQQQPGSSSSVGSGLQPPEVPPLEAPREEALQGHQK
jgi:hypothetical protein